MQISFKKRYTPRPYGATPAGKHAALNKSTDFQQTRTEQT